MCKLEIKFTCDTLKEAFGFFKPEKDSGERRYLKRENGKYVYIVKFAPTEG